jgi:putative hemolysin
MLYFELGIVAFLIVINGLLAMSELAVVSARPARLKTMADRGVTGARRAIALAEDPGRFLSTVQIGITMVGVLSGAFSGATLGLRLTEWMISKGMGVDAAEALGVTIVVAGITYASLIIGELVPKQVALRDPETMAARVAPAMVLLAKIARPLVWFLDVSGRGILFILGQSGEIDEKITDEEIKTLIAEAETAGVMGKGERSMLSGVMRLADRSVRGIMTPRTEIRWLDLSQDTETLHNLLRHASHSRLPVSDGTIDNMTGIVQVRDLLSATLSGQPLDIRTHMREATIIHDNAGAMDAVSLLRKAEIPMLFVYDEYGHFEGIVTPADVMQAISGITDTAHDDAPAVKRADGSWLLAGYLPIDEAVDKLGIALPENRDYETLAGFVLAAFGRLPKTGDVIERLGWRFEVIDLDGRRIDKILATRQPS